MAIQSMSSCSSIASAEVDETEIVALPQNIDVEKPASSPGAVRTRIPKTGAHRLVQMLELKLTEFNAEHLQDTKSCIAEAQREEDIANQLDDQRRRLIEFVCEQCSTWKENLKVCAAASEDHSNALSKSILDLAATLAQISRTVEMEQCNLNTKANLQSRLDYVQEASPVFESTLKEKE